MRSLVCLAILLPGCGQPARTPPPLTQQAYVWQRDWTPEVSASVQKANAHLDGLVLLSAQIRAFPSPHPQPSTPSAGHASLDIRRPKLDWDALRSFGKPVALALRIDGQTLPPTQPVTELIRNLLQTATDHSVTVSHFQIDYDCPEAALAVYRAWLRPVRSAVAPLPLRITTLPAWLKRSDFVGLLTEVDGFVIQVHSVPTRLEREQAALFDPERAARWVKQAAQLGHPFSVALPTYTALVGFDPQGRYLGMALDGIQPSWPAGTRITEFGADAEDLARFSKQLQTNRPPGLEGVFWYRLPVGSGQRNWRWPTFEAVLQGRVPTHRLEARTNGAGLVDISLHNTGEAEERLESSVCVRWETGEPLAVEALPGWTTFQSGHEIRFTRTALPLPRLLPGGQSAIGWIRFPINTPFHVEIPH